MWAVAGDEEFHGTAWLHKQTAMLVTICVAPPCIYAFIYIYIALQTCAQSVSLPRFLLHILNIESARNRINSFIL